MTTKKLVKRDFHNAILAHIEATGFATENISTEQFVEFFTHELELLNRKNTSEKKPTAQQVANKGTLDTIISVLKASDVPMTITELQKASAELGELSNQRISAIIRTALGSTIVRVEDKRKAYFKAI